MRRRWRPMRPCVQLCGATRARTMRSFCGGWRRHPGSRRRRGKIPGYVPVPVRLTDCGLPPPLSTKLRLPFLMPLASGWNLTLTVQLAPAASVLPQVLAEIRKLPATVMLVTLSDEVPTLVRVTNFAGLVLPTPTDPKFMAVGERLAIVPTPARLTIWGLLVALS